jgi:hypothetical protein
METTEEDKGLAAFTAFADGCPYRIQPPLQRRPGNVICLEIAQPLARCTLRPPAHWPEGSSVRRWLGSGGSPLVLGHCSRQCALGTRWCRDCGHRADAHNWSFRRQGCNVGSLDDGCRCEAFHA